LNEQKALVRFGLRQDGAECHPRGRRENLFALGRFASLRIRNGCKGYSDVNPTTGRYIQWWIEACSRCWGHDGCYVPSSANQDGSIFTIDLADGIYLDQDELNERQGLWIPLRTETQRWFCDVIGTIVRTRRKLETHTDHKRLPPFRQGEDLGDPFFTRNREDNSLPSPKHHEHLD
jgi:hypothetical protein